MAQVLITAEFFGELGNEALRLIEASGVTYELRREIENEFLGKEEVFLSLVGEVEALIVSGKAQITRRVVERAPHLRVISKRGVGVDNIDVAFARQRGVVVAYTPHVVHRTVADHTLAMLLGLAKRIIRHDRNVRKGKWVRNLWSVEVLGKTLGIVGLGQIGKSVAKRALAFEMRILAHDPAMDEDFAREHGILPHNLEELLRESDFVTLHVPLTEHTRGLIGEEELSLMKSSAFLINTSRGAIIEEKALARALKTKRIAGAGLDVFEKEPLPAQSPLRSLDNLLFTPHAASNTPECFLAMEAAAAEHAIAVLKGKMPEWIA